MDHGQDPGLHTSTHLAMELFEYSKALYNQYETN